MAHLGVSFEPPSTDQYEEHARYDCMQLVRDGRLNGANLLSLRDAGAEWSTIRDEATADVPPPSPNGCLNTADCTGVAPGQNMSPYERHDRPQGAARTLNRTSVSRSGAEIVRPRGA